MKLTLNKALILSCIMMTSCSHENPLLSQDKRATAQFLIDADLFAERKLKDKHHTGSDYPACIDGTIVDQSYCDDLYQQMVNYAKDQANPAFKTTRVSDLEQAEVYYRVKDDYQAISFGLIPEK